MRMSLNVIFFLTTEFCMNWSRINQSRCKMIFNTIISSLFQHLIIISSLWTTYYGLKRNKIFHRNYTLSFDNSTPIISQQKFKQQQLILEHRVSQKLTNTFFSYNMRQSEMTGIFFETSVVNKKTTRCKKNISIDWESLGQKFDSIVVCHKMHKRKLNLVVAEGYTWRWSSTNRQVPEWQRVFRGNAIFSIVW